MRSKSLLAILLTSSFIMVFAADAKTVRSDDPAVAPILDSFSRPTLTHFQVNEIKTATGEYTHCETHGASTDCTPQTKFLVVYQLILMFDVNGKTVKIVGGCLPSEERHCKSLMPLSTTPLQCGAVEKDVRRCSVEGWNRFVIEKKKRQYYIYPAFYNKPDRHFYIPLASIDDSVVAPD